MKICSNCAKENLSLYTLLCPRCYADDRMKRIRDESPKIQCACGCGELIPSIRTDGESSLFKHGHNSKGANNPAYKGGSYVNTYGYVLLNKPGHPNLDKSGYVAEHRFIMSQHLGRPIKKDEDVHHINGNRQDNRIENLELLSHGEHKRLHAKQKAIEYRIKMANRLCELCGTNKTTIHSKRGGANWFRYDGGFICQSCYQKNRRMA